MKTLFVIFTFILLFAARRKKQTTQEIMQNMLTSHKWELDSLYITEGGVFSVQVPGPGTEMVTYAKNTYSVYTAGSPSNLSVVNYKYDAVNSRIYYWHGAGHQNMDIYHNVENLSPSHLSLYDMIYDGQGATHEYVYFYHAK